MFGSFVEIVKVFLFVSATRLSYGQLLPTFKGTVSLNQCLRLRCILISRRGLQVVSQRGWDPNLGKTPS